MMTRRLSPYHPLSWALWVKFLVALAVGLALFAIPAVIFIQNGIYEIGEQNARSFVSETGIKHSIAVSNALNGARNQLTNFMVDPVANRVLTGFLLRDVRTSAQIYLPPTSENAIENLLRDALISPAASPFENVRLLDRSGQLLVEISITSASFTPRDESNSAAYRAAQNAMIQGSTSVFAVTEGESPVVEVVHATVWRDGGVIGYVVARLSSNRIFLNNIRLDEPTQDFSAYTFLTTSRQDLIAPASIIPRALDAHQSVAVDRALRGQSGAAVYTAQDGMDYIGYYAPIAGTPFVLVTQAPASDVFANTLAFFQTRTFVFVVGVIALVIILVLLFNQLIAPPLNRVRQAALAVASGDFDVEMPDAARGDEIGLLAAAVLNMREQVRLLIAELEERIATRTRDISATQDISRYATTQRDLQTLMNRVVDLIAERFPNIYHAQIFLIDDTGSDAVLRASTGEAGQQLLSRGHRLAVGSLSVIGQVTQQGRLIVARDAAASQVHRRNEFLQETRAELAIPLRVGERIIGALDVQSKIRDAFGEDQVNVLQTMADQIAIAIENARLYEESVRRFQDIEENNRQATRRAWREFMRDQRVESSVKEAGYVTDTDLSDLRRAALETGEPAVGQVTPRQTIPIAIPVQLRGHILGAVEWELPAQSLSEEKLELAQELANRLALSLDNARLFQESQRTTERERLVNTIAAKLTAQTSINDILETAIREVGQALRAPQVSIRLQQASGSGGNNDHPSINNG